MTDADELKAIDAAIAKICEGFGDGYWRAKDASGDFPEEFYRAVAHGGWLGICMPEEVGGAGRGVLAAATMMHAVATSGAGMGGASAVHINIWGLQPVVVYGTAAQKARFLPPLIAGRQKACFAVTEPDAGSDTTSLTTFAERRGDRYIVNGRKIWITTAQQADMVLLLARTTPRDQVKRRTDGLSLFYTPLDRSKIEVREIPKLGRHAVDSNLLFIDGLEVPAENLIGSEGAGFAQILHGFNPERILVAAEAIGIGRAALRKASDYAQVREVFGRPIGQNQGIQHPLAKCWMHLEAADLMMKKAAALYDAGEPCGLEANTAKYLAGEAAFTACETAMMSMGGMGYATECDVERYLRESLITRIAPVSPNMILNFVAEKALHLPRSY